MCSPPKLPPPPLFKDFVTVLSSQVMTSLLFNHQSATLPFKHHHFYLHSNCIKARLNTTNPSSKSPPLTPLQHNTFPHKPPPKRKPRNLKCYSILPLNLIISIVAFVTVLSFVLNFFQRMSISLSFLKRLHKLFQRNVIICSLTNNSSVQGG